MTPRVGPSPTKTETSDRRSSTSPLKRLWSWVEAGFQAHDSQR